MSGTWSAQVERRFALQLPADVRVWLDEEHWQHPGGAEFCRPLTPAQLMDPEPGTIWAGFMLPDTLPVIGNNYGDWLCLRIAPSGTVAEVVCWSHCGGDWLPYGSNLAEALLYDAAARVIHPRKPEFTEPDPPSEQVFRPAEWARHWVGGGPTPIAPFWTNDEKQERDRQVLLKQLSQARVAEVAVLRDSVLHHLESPLKLRSDAKLAEKLNVAWEPNFVRWLFDTDLIPPQTREELCQHFSSGDGQLLVQNWDAAYDDAQRVIALRSDLGWAYDTAGWAAERRGDLQQAVQFYLQGLHTSLFSDDTVRFRTHWIPEGMGKFAAARLADLKSSMSPQQQHDPYLALFWENDPESLRVRVRDFWTAKARLAADQGDPLEAYHCYYQAGWDMGLHFVSSYEEILDGLIRSAKDAGSAALASVAELHRRCLST
jgi:tetratricopeptide (TPR) repeat protein